MSSLEAGQTQRLLGSLQDEQFKTSLSLITIASLGNATRAESFRYRVRGLDKSDSTLKMLDWLALAFVRDPQDDAAAVSINLTPGKVTLYVSLNKGAPDAEDRKTGELLIGAFRDVLCKPTMPHKDKMNVFAKLMLERNPHRIQRKVHLLSTLIPPTMSGSQQVSTPLAYLLKLFSDWQENGHEETSKILTKWVSRSEGTCPNPSEALKEVLMQLFGIDAGPTVSLFHSATPSELQQSFRCFEDIIHLVTCILFSDFLKSAQEHPEQHRASSISYLLHFQQRLERIQCYSIGALYFVIEGLALVQNTLRSTNADHGIEICWVGDSLTMPPGHGVQYMYPSPPLGLVEDLFRRIDFSQLTRQAGEDEIKKTIAKLCRQIADSLPANATVVPRWHCELQLITYLLEKKIIVQQSKHGESYIGTSKPPCQSCHAFIQELQVQNPQRHWKLCGTSFKQQATWAIPAGTVGDHVATMIDKDREDLLYDHVKLDPEVMAAIDRNSPESLLFQGYTYPDTN